MDPLLSASPRRSVTDLLRCLRPSRRACLLTGIAGLVTLSCVVLETRDVDPPPDRPLAELRQPGWVTALVFTKDSRLLVSGVGPKAGGAILWDVDAQREVWTFGEEGGATRAIALKPDDTTLAVGGKDGFIRFYDFATRQMTGLLPPRGPSFVNNLAYAPDGKTLVAEELTVRVYDVATNREGQVLEACAFVAFAPDGRSFATGGLDGHIHFWDTATGAKIRTLPRQVMATLAMALAGDGSRLAVGDLKGNLQIWDIEEDRCLWNRPAHDDSIHAVAFSPDGQTVATASKDRTVKLWDVASGKEVATLRGHTKAVYCVAFAPNGQLLATGGYDRTVRLWALKRR